MSQNRDGGTRYRRRWKTRPTPTKRRVCPIYRAFFYNCLYLAFSTSFLSSGYDTLREGQHTHSSDLREPPVSRHPSSTAHTKQSKLVFSPSHPRPLAFTESSLPPVRARSTMSTVQSSLIPLVHESSEWVVQVQSLPTTAIAHWFESQVCRKSIALDLSPSS